MHDSARKRIVSLVRLYVKKKRRGHIVEIGSRQTDERDWTPRHLFIGWPYTGVDIRDGVGVDKVVEECGAWTLERPADVILSVNCLEHCKRPWEVICNAADNLKPRGVMILVAPFLWHLHDHPGDYYRFTGNGLAELMINAGIEPLDCGEMLAGTVCKKDAWCVGRKRK